VFFGFPNQLGALGQKNVGWTFLVVTMTRARAVDL
jgi:hypothetical protein